MQHLKLIAPAKINLVLAVGAKRPDGFHNVDTIMHTLALHDTLEMRYTPLTSDDAANSAAGLVVNLACEARDGIAMLDVLASDNIVYRALYALAEALGRTAAERFDITLIKRIPHEAGLGGGSSDAAAALRGAAHIWGIAEDDVRLRQVARNLGADVPFFLQGGCAYLTGRGDELHHTLTPRKDLVLLVRPDQGIATKEAYARFDQDPVKVEPGYLMQLQQLQDARTIEPWNNFEATAHALVPELVAITHLAHEQGIDQVLLCGSGSALCLFCDSLEQATQFSVLAERRGCWTRISSLAAVAAQQIEQVW